MIGRGLQRLLYGPVGLFDSVLNRLQVVLGIADVNAILHERHDLPGKVRPVL